jgi:hypothetical protein
MSARIRIVALAASAAISAAGLNAAAQSMPNITAPKTAANNAAAATNSHIEAEQNTGAPPPQSAASKPTATPYTKPAAQAPAPKPAPAPAPQQSAAKPAVGVQNPGSKPPAAPAVVAAKPAPAPQTKGGKAAPAAAPATAPDQSSSVSERGGKSEISLLRETFTYQPDNRRDPFLSLMRTGDLRPMVSDLRLVAVIYDPQGRSVAILRDLQTKEQYRVKVGQTLGRMRVNQIRPQQVIFTIEEIGMTRQEALGMNATTTTRAQ